jgi:hypothetical protein
MYRVVLALLHQYHRHRKQAAGGSPKTPPPSSVADLANDIAHFCAHLPITSDKLLKVGF